MLTGHNDGRITINVAEADDAEREKRRLAMHEPYRTLLGHFRHEIGHYYWDRLIAGRRALEPFRELFGDERQDYAQALKSITTRARPRIGRNTMSAPMRARIPGRTGRRRGPITCTSPTPWRRRRQADFGSGRNVRTNRP